MNLGWGVAPQNPGKGQMFFMICEGGLFHYMEKIKFGSLFYTIDKCVLQIKDPIIERQI